MDSSQRNSGYERCLKNAYRWVLEKQEDLRKCSLLVTVTPLWHVAQWVSRAPQHHTLPAFLNLDGKKKPLLNYLVDHSKPDSVDVRKFFY